MYKQIKYFLNIFAHKFLKLYVYRGLQATVENEPVRERGTLCNERQNEIAVS